MILNLDLIQHAMASLGLSQAALAERCNVSREAVSIWLAGKSMPRPNKLRLLSLALELDLEKLCKSAPVMEPPVACQSSRAIAFGLAGQLRELVPYTRPDALFTPPVLDAPRLDVNYIGQASAHIRRRLGVNGRAPLRREHLLRLHHDFGTILVPALWPADASAVEDACSVYLPESKTYWVIFGLNTRNDDFNYLLAHQLAHCYSLHALEGQEAADFADYFAQELLFPRDAAREALDLILASRSPAEHAKSIAAAYDISVMTVMRQAERIAPDAGIAGSGFDTAPLLDAWKAGADTTPTAAYCLFGSNRLSMSEYIAASEALFNTPVFHAIAKWQQREGGRAAAFVASLLNIRLEQALELSHALFSRATPTQY